MLRRFSLILLLFPVALQAQISAPESNAKRYTQYPVTNRRDPVFIFCSSSSTTGALTAESPGGNGPFIFDWKKYDPATGLFSAGIKTETVLTSTASELGDGGYSVHITDANGYDTTLYAWVNLDNPVSNAALKHYTCTYVALDGTAAADNFYYYDLSTGASVKLPDAIDFEWTSDPVSSIKPGQIDPIISIPPLSDTRYILQVADSFTCTSTSSFDYQSIHVKADFTVDPLSGEAPLEVTFTDKSIRADSYLWNFGDDSVSYIADPPAHKYYIPGKYTITLTIESNLFCTDTYSKDIEVKESAMEMSNVFTPNGDGINDYFVPAFSSMKSVSIQIFSKSGKRVYHYESEGENVSDWKGWDGKVNNSERYAEPGIYYYIIRGKGWDDVSYNGPGYRGIVYLFR